jgi:glycosyltransferase involved in cell wall biosynthesis
MFGGQQRIVVMRVLVTASAHFAVTNDGALWTSNASLRYDFWARYLETYDEVLLMARAHSCEAPPPGWGLVCGPGIKGVPLPDHVGPWGFAKNYWGIVRTIRAVLPQVEALQLRLPCSLGTEVYRQLPPGRPYGVEVVADPYDVFARGSVRHPLRPLFRWLFPRRLRLQCARACAAAYVTAEALQRRYPCPASEVGFSDVILPDQAFALAARPPRPAERTTTVITVGSLNQLYKAPDVLIDAVAACVREGLDLRLVLVGDGQFRPELEARAARLGLNERVCFCGNLPGSAAVRERLDEADLFCLPSHQEGLPKAMVEAMARALPCIGSTVGGIPELLPATDMVRPGDVPALARKIREVVCDPERLTRMSAVNFTRARDYREDLLRARRLAFYQTVKDRTAAWFASGTPRP